MTQLFHILVCSLTVLLCDYLSAQEKFVIPDGQQVSENKQLVRKVYAEDIKSIENAFQRMQVTNKLLNEAKATKDVASHFALLLVAKEIYLEGSDFAGVLEVSETIDRHFEIDKVKEYLQILDQAISSKLDAETHQQIYHVFEEVINDAIRQNDYDSAKELGILATSCAKKTRDREIQSDAKDIMKEVEALEAEFEQHQITLAKLETMPEDGNASLEVGRFLCFINADWVRGLPLLAKGTDQKLSTIASSELAKSPDPVSVGDAWWEISETMSGLRKRNVATHASNWYRKALPALSGLAKAKVEARLSSGHPEPALSATLGPPEKSTRVIAEDQHVGKAGDRSENNIYAIELKIPVLVNEAKIHVNAQAAKLNQTSNGNILVSIDGGEWVIVEKWTTETCAASQRYKNWQQLTLQSSDRTIARQLRVKFEFTSGREALVINYVGWVR